VKLNNIANFIFLVFSALFFAACSGEELSMDKFVEYEGPLMETDSVHTLYSDSAVVRAKLVAAKQFQFESGDQEFPNGIYIEFYEVDGSISSTIKADKGYYTKEENLYTGVGNVVVRNIEKKEQLDTEELFWKPDEDRVFTDKFVTIQTEDELLMGDGLTSNQDFSSYRILKPRGDFSIDDDDL
jgi:LPS export ABC transporter protein LptC